MKKITLSKETLRSLDTSDLEEVLGGADTKTKQNTKTYILSKYPTCDYRKCRD